MSLEKDYLRKQAADSVEEEVFSKPPQQFGPLLWYFLNDDLDEKELRRQVREFAEKGSAGFFMMSRYGLEVPYMSEKWHRCLEVLVQEAEKNHLEVWLNDEDPFFSGQAGGEVTFDHPEFANYYLSPIKRRVKGPGRVRIQLGKGKFIAAFAVPITREKPDPEKALDISNQVGILRTDWVLTRKVFGAEKYYLLGKEFPHPRWDTKSPLWALDWIAPSGDFLLLAFLALPRTSSGQIYADPTNPEAIEYYIRRTHERYRHRFASKIGRVIPGIFTDEPAFHPFSWSEHIETEFRKRKGYHLKEKLPHLFLRGGATTRRIRSDYREVLSDLYAKNFFKKISEYCNRIRLMLVGHINDDELLALQSICEGDIFRNLSHLNIPGTDIIIPAVGDRKHAVLNIGQKIVSSISAQKGAPITLSEAYAASDWWLDFATMKRIADWLFSFGINMIVPHGSYYSIDGLRKFDAPPSHSYQMTWWADYAHFTKYIARLSYLLRGGKEEVSVGLILPLRTFWVLEPTEHRKALEVERKFAEVTRALLENQIPFHILPERALEAGTKSSTGRIRIGKCAYRTIIVPPGAVIDERTARNLLHLAEAGGEVYFLERKPRVFNYLGPGRPRQRPFAARRAHLHLLTQKQAHPGTFAASLSKSIERPLRLSGLGARQIFLQHRKKAGRDIIFLANIYERSARIRLHTEIEPLEVWDPTTGERFSLPRREPSRKNSIPLRLEGGESLLLVTAKRPASEALPEPGQLKKLRLPDRWLGKPLSENCLVLSRWQANAGRGWKQVKPDPLYMAIKSFQGTAKARESYYDVPLACEPEMKKPLRVHYRTKFKINEAPRRLFLVIGKKDIGGKWSILLNGKKITGWKNVRRFDNNNIEANIRSVAKRGMNIIEIIVETDDRRGGLLDAPRIFGDFVLKRTNAFPVMEPAREAITSGDWCRQGYPYYSGKVEYSQEFEWQKDVGRAFLRIGKVRDMAEVRLNGKPCGLVAWPPWRVEVTGALRRGRNRVSVVVTNSLYNLIYGRARRSGLTGPVEILWEAPQE